MQRADLGEWVHLLVGSVGWGKKREEDTTSTMNECCKLNIQCVALTYSVHGVLQVCLLYVKCKYVSWASLFLFLNSLFLYLFILLFL